MEYTDAWFIQQGVSSTRHTLDWIAADTNYFNMYSHTGMDPEILKKEGALCRSPDFRFQMVLKTKKTLETVSF